MASAACSIAGMDRTTIERLASSSAEGLIGGHARCIRDVDARLREQEARPAEQGREIAELKARLAELDPASRSRGGDSLRMDDAPDIGGNGKVRGGKRSG